MCNTNTQDRRPAIACRLSVADLGTQAERWGKLRREAGLARSEIADGLCLSFRDDGAVEDELRALVAVENECCAWAEWTVARADGRLVMHAASNGEGIATLHSMFRGEWSDRAHDAP